MPSSSYFKNEQTKKKHQKSSQPSELVPYDYEKRTKHQPDQQLKRSSSKRRNEKNEENDAENAIIVDNSTSLKINELRKRYRQILTTSIVLVFFSVTPISLVALIFSLRAKTQLDKRQPDLAELNMDRAFSVNLFTLIIGALFMLTVISITYPHLKDELDKVAREFKSIS